MKFILFFVFVFFLVGILAIPASLAQDAIPSWIKNNAGWWADDKIDDFTFAQGIGFLIKNEIIQINDLPTTSDGEIAIENDIAIPSWIKNNAGWWADDNISDSDFLYGIKFLVETNIIQFQSDADHENTKNIGKYLLQDLKALVFKVPFKEDKFNCKCVRRMLLPLEHCMLDNSPNALPNMLADLLLYQPQKIKVFSIDMQLSSKRDMSYGVMGASFWDRYYPIAGHDPYSQYQFVEYLYNNNFISVDSTLKAILDLGIVEYMKKLQEVYLDKAL